MKRIDEKIKEIEKKDKSSRMLYIAFIGVILVAMAIILSQIRGINERDLEIAQQNDELKITNKNLEKTIKDLTETRGHLDNSLRPEVYWEYIEKENTHASYISYLTNDWDIEKPTELVDKAIKKIDALNGQEHLKGWIYCGLETQQQGYKPKMIDTDVPLLQIVWRKDSEEYDDKSMPEKGDIVQLLSSRIRNMYPTKATNSENPVKHGGWRPGTKAYVKQVKKVGAEIKIELRYY